LSARIAISLGASFLGYATHAGFLTRLHELGVRPVAVGGSSAGAIAAGLYAAGVEAAKMREVVTSWKLRQSFINQTPWLTHYIRNTFFEGNPGVFKPDAAVTCLESVFGDVQIEHLQSPRFLAAVSNLEDRTTHFLQSGSLARAMVASCCVPTVFQPLEHAGMACFDGGIAHETPIDPWLEDEGVDTIVLHRVMHHGSASSRVVPLNLINLTARAHACASEQLLHYRLRLAEMHGKRVIIATTTHDRPTLFSGKQMPGFYEAGAAEAQRFFDAELRTLITA
jgi:NTE family protein